MKLPDVSLLRTLTMGAEARALEKAKALSAEGKLDKAAAALESALSKSPDSETLLFEAARCYLGLGKNSDAGECLKKILRRNPRQVDAVQEFTEEMRMKMPSVGVLYEALAEHHVRQDEHGKALDAMERIPSEELRVYHGRQLAKWEAVRKNAPHAKLTKGSLHSAFFVALALERQGDYAKAAKAYRAIIEKNPEESPKICARLEAILARDYANLALRFALVDLRFQSGQAAEAMAQLEQALEVDAATAAPEIAARMEQQLARHANDPTLLWMLVRARRAEGKFPEMLAALAGLSAAGSHKTEAVRLLEDLTPRMEQHPELRLALADAYAAMGKPVLAVEAVLQASEKIGDEGTEPALEKIARGFPEYARTHLLLGDIDFRAGRADRGVERYERALSLSPEEGPVLVPKLLGLLETGGNTASVTRSLAQIYLREGDRSRGAVLLRHCVRTDPACAPQIVETLRQALPAEPSHAGLRIALAEAHLAARQPVDAVTALASLLKDEPGRAREVLHTLSAASRSVPEAAAAAAEVFRDLAAREVLPAACRFGEGEAALCAGDVGEAVTAFQEAARMAPDRIEEIREAFETLAARHPETPEVRYILAGLYLDRQNPAAAAREIKKIPSLNSDLLAPILAKYREALQASPDSIELRLGLSAALLLSRAYEQVQTLATETLRIRDDESTAPIQLDLGDACLERGDVTSAVKRYYNAYRKSPALASDTARRLERVLELNPNLSLASLALGKVLPDCGRVADGVQRLLEAFRSDPRIAEGVLTELERIRAAHPVSPEAATARIEILCATGNDAVATEAIADLVEARPDAARSVIPRLESILGRSPRLAPAHLALARAHRALGDVPRAAEACRTAYRADRSSAPRVIRACAELAADDPKCPIPYLTMAEIYLTDNEVAAAAEKLHQAATRCEGPADETVELLEKVLARDPGTPRVAWLAAEIQLRFGRHAGAVRLFRLAMDRDPGMLDAALKGLQSVLEKEPDLGEARLARAQALALRQEFDAAVEDLEAALRSAPSLAPAITAEALRIQPRRPGNYRLVTLLADLLLASGRLDEAAQLLESERKRKWERGERLALLVRLWRVRLARGETLESQRVLEEAEGLAPDRDRLLARVHECVVGQIRSETGALQEKAAAGKASAADLERLAGHLLALGDTARALDLTGAGGLDASRLLRVHSEAAMLESDYFRAAEILKPLGPSARLAYAAERSGDLLLASRTLEQLASRDPDPRIRSALHRVYALLVQRDLDPGRDRLAGETVVRFGT
jgi:tetratricopeptide (TPR) repeat protein